MKKRDKNQKIVVKLMGAIERAIGLCLEANTMIKPKPRHIKILDIKSVDSMIKRFFFFAYDNKRKQLK